MIKVALYFETEAVKDMDLSFPDQGNPGVGGTLFNFIALPFYFNKYVKNRVEFTLYTQNGAKLPANLNFVEAKDVFEAAEKCSLNGTDIFIWRPTNRNPKDFKFICKCDSYPFYSVGWMHNAPFNNQMLKMMHHSKKFVRFVAVGQELMDLFRDHPIFNKSEKIYNGFDSILYQPTEGDQKDEKLVSYTGALVYAKGFHVLAKAWPKVLQEVPDARLCVIGTGSLYNSSQSMGKWNIASEDYERNYIRKYLADKNGDPIKSVSFLGRLGNEKIEIQKKSLIGVVNPTGNSEVCPGSAIEYQAAGTPVVSIARWGLLDTVKNHQTGILGKKESDLANNLIYLLRNPEIAKDFGQKGIGFIDKTFDFLRISHQWYELFADIMERKPASRPGIQQNVGVHHKRIREWFRMIKDAFPIFKLFPSLVSIRIFLIRAKARFTKK